MWDTSIIMTENMHFPCLFLSKAGHLDVVRLLCESGASPKNETNYGCAPIWFAASEGHNNVFKYLMHKEHDTMGLMEDKRFIYNLMVVSKNHNNKPIEEFILVSPAPVDTAAKLSNIFMVMSTKVCDFFTLSLKQLIRIRKYYK